MKPSSQVAAVQDQIDSCSSLLGLVSEWDFVSNRLVFECISHPSTIPEGTRIAVVDSGFNNVAAGVVLLERSEHYLAVRIDECSGRPTPGDRVMLVSRNELEKRME